MKVYFHSRHYHQQSFFIKIFGDANNFSFASHTLIRLPSFRFNMGMFFLVSVAAYGFSSFSFLILIPSFAGCNVMPLSFGKSNAMSFSVHLKLNARDSFYLHHFQVST